ncbi:MAG: lysoplasmalogenase [Nocardioides sp.]|nr:lysoplasmalogenase [Nocardioides sp.]
MSLRLPSRVSLRLAYVALAAYDAHLAGSADPRAHAVRRFTKPALMPLLAAGSAGSGAPRSVLVAQAASWVGDVALQRHSDEALRTGVTAFGAAHLAYTAGFLATRRSPAAIPATPAAPSAPRPLHTRKRARFAALAAVNALALGQAAGRRNPALRGPVTAYGHVLGLMATAALSARGTRSGQLLVGAGALSFVVSDSVLGTREFVWRDSPPALETAVMATYTAAQLLLAEGAARL